MNTMDRFINLCYFLALSFAILVVQLNTQKPIEITIDNQSVSFNEKGQACFYVTTKGYYGDKKLKEVCLKDYDTQKNTTVPVLP